jgi:hypothetical protein
MCDFKFPEKKEFPEPQDGDELLIPDVFEDENFDEWTW